MCFKQTIGLLILNATQVPGSISLVWHGRWVWWCHN